MNLRKLADLNKVLKSLCLYHLSFQNFIASLIEKRESSSTQDNQDPIETFKLPCVTDWNILLVNHLQDRLSFSIVTLFIPEAELQVLILLKKFTVLVKAF